MLFPRQLSIMKEIQALYLLIFLSRAQSGILYPKASESRQILSLDGFWDFALTNTSSVEKMAVPSSYNDVGTSEDLRSHVGVVWYRRKFFAPKSWSGQKVWIRFGSVCRGAEVLINGQLAVSHDIGHLPFQGEISSLLDFGGENTITVAVDNTLLNKTIPQGTVTKLRSGRIKQTYSFDFFNYAGIDRSVVLYTTPTTYIDDISVKTSIDGADGIVNYSIAVEGSEPVTAKITLLDKKGQVVSNDTKLEGTLPVQNANFWWPYLMDTNPGYLYSLQIQLDSSKGLLDKYTLPVGIRTISWDSTSLKINNKPIYLKGFGRHEDSDIRGKGLDLPLIIRDYNLIKWIGANAYRTSHYPYAEEIMDLADELGIMIIDECPSVNTEFFFDSLLTKHKNSLTELITRDKNRPSVIMWSAANEPKSQDPPAKNYFKAIIEHIKGLDITRPTTIVEAGDVNSVYSSEFVDIVSFNRYNGWYSDDGNLDVVSSSVVAEATAWHNKFKKPVIMQEYGGGTLEGLHSIPNFIWSEEYQVDLMSKHFQAFDELRPKGFFIGEFIWNFADFKTAQSHMRVGGNKKGIFTRNRQPKASAHHLRKRYWTLAAQIYNVSLPNDLYNYVVKPTLVRDEL